MFLLLKALFTAFPEKNAPTEAVNYHRHETLFVFFSLSCSLSTVPTPTVATVRQVVFTLRKFKHLVTHETKLNQTDVVSDEQLL